MPVLLLWFSTSTLGYSGAHWRPRQHLTSMWAVLAAISAIATILLVPWMHHRVLGFKHARLCYGNLQSSFPGALGAFYEMHLVGLVLVIGAAIASGLLAVAASALASTVAGHFGSSRSADIASWCINLLFILVVYVVVWSFYTAKTQRTMWGRTTLGTVRFEAHIEAVALFGLMSKSAVLTILTLGLYWPFAAIAVARYRIENVAVVGSVPVANTVEGIGSVRRGALGESTTDLFAVDIGL